MIDLEEARRLVELGKQQGWLVMPTKIIPMQEPVQTEPKERCRRCGRVRMREQEYCSKCGTQFRQSNKE